jgi:hypothetical protein
VAGVFAWTSWKPFPDPRSGAPIEAPIGPGVYEVRRISNGETVAFDHAPNVARALLAIAVPSSRLWSFERPRADAGDLEYRTCTASTSMGAKAIAARMSGQRRLYWRQAVPI